MKRFFARLEKAVKCDIINISTGKRCFCMKNYYSTVDNIVLTFSDIEEKNGFDEITVYFERPNNDGFDFAEGKLPNNMFYKTHGFSEDELLELEGYLKNNNFLIWEIAKEKYGVTVA